MPNPKSGEEAPWTAMRALQWTASYLEKYDIEHARVDAEILLAHTLGCSRIDLYMHHDQPLNVDELAAYRETIKRRARREPVAYITGHKEFWSLDLKVSPAVLIPRPETECLVEVALNELKKRGGDRIKKILELGTGSGAISIALAKERPNDLYWASDASPDAIQIAKENARRHDVEHLIRFVAGKWFAFFSPEASAFDVIVSNPPYIRTADMNTLAPEIRDYEPGTALDGGDQGIVHLGGIIEDASHFLAHRGCLLLEMGADQRNAVQKIAGDASCYQTVDFLKDYGGHDRIAILQK